MKPSCILLAASLCATASSASAADRAVRERPAALGRVLACRNMESRDERLACFDREVGAFDTAEKTRQIVVVDRAQVSAAKRSLFGLRLPDLGLFGDRQEKPGGDELDTLVTTIANFSRAGGGEAFFTLQDGASWIQTDDREVAGAVRPGTEVTIQRGALGSYFATIKGRSGFKVRRVG